MKITFVQRQIFALPGIASMAGRVRRGGHEADLVIENAERRFEEVLAATEPDVVGVTLTSSDINWFHGVLTRIRRAVPDAFFLAGGIHPTIHPSLLDECPALDAICIGEGEEAVVELLDALEASRESPEKNPAAPGSSSQCFDVQTGSPLRFDNQLSPITCIRNLHVRWEGKIYRNKLRPLLVDLDAYPEDREVCFHRYPQLAEDTLLQYISSRGCPFPCAFCVNETLNRIFRGLGPVQRRKSVDGAVEEICRLRQLYPNAETVFFIDDLFLSDRDWVHRFLPLYHRKIGLPFICSAGPRTIDEETADLLAASGCASVEFGIETGSESKRRGIFNKKAFTDEEFRRQIGLLKSRGIDIYAPSMFVFPTETPADSFRTVEFYHELKIDHPFSSFLFPYPHTAIYDEAVREGCIPPDFRAEDLPGNYFTQSVCRIPRRRVIENIQYLFYFFVKSPRFYRWFRWLVRLPVPLKPLRYAGLFFWFKNWKRMGYGETIRYFWRFRHSS